MKFRQPGGGYVEVTWSDHRAGCPKCSEVDPDKPASFVKACAVGSPLLMEDLKERQAPVERQKQTEVKEWAKQAGVFKVDAGLSKERVKAITKYVE